MTSEVQFFNPYVIYVNELGSTIEAVVNSTPISVHSVYICDRDIEIQCVNTTSSNENPSYEIQDLNGKKLSTTEIETIFQESFVYLRPADMSGVLVNESRLQGSNLNVINEDLINLIKTSDISGNFSLKKEIFKTISSYLTNHTSLSLANSITCISGNEEQLNATSFISQDLTQYTTDGSGIIYDTLKSYLVSNNSNEVFGMNSIKELIFILSSKISVENNVINRLDASNFSALSSIQYKDGFEDEVGDPLNPHPRKLNGHWFTALCFQINKEPEPEPESEPEPEPESEPEPEPEIESTNVVVSNWNNVVSQTTVTSGYTGDYYGIGMNLNADGSVIVVGGIRYPTSYKGHAYIYRNVNGSWVQELRVIGGMNYDYVGFGVSITPDGNRVVISSVYNNTISYVIPTHNETMVYEYSAGVWSQLGGLLAPSTSVDISDDGNTVATGHYRGNHNNHYGRLTIYDWNGSSWILNIDVQGQNIRNASHFRFGGSVKISGDGNTIIVGTYNYQAGGAYIYTRQGNGTFVPQFTAWNASSIPYNTSATKIGIGGWSNRNGISINKEGNIIAVSSVLSNVARVEIFKYENSAWVLIKTLTNNANDDFGVGSLSMSGDAKTIVCGMNPSNTIKIFKLDDNWNILLTKTFTRSANYGFASEVSQNGNVVISGSFSESSSSTVYIDQAEVL